MALIGRRGLVLVGLAMAVACTRRDPPRSLGRAVVGAPALAMQPSPDGAWLAYLHDCRAAQDRALPRGATTCTLAVVPSAGGAPQRVATGVNTLGSGFDWAPRSGHVLAALADYDLAAARGSLVTWDGGQPRTVAAQVTFHGFDREGARLGWIAAGQLFVGDVRGAGARPVERADRLSTFEFGGERGLEILARRAAQSGATLLWARGAAARALAEDVHDYRFGGGAAVFAFTSGPARALSIGSGAGDPRVRPAVARDVHSFLFAPRSERLAFVADASPGRQGDLWTVSGSGQPTLVARRVGEPRWTKDGAQLAWLQDYDPRSRTGTLAVGGSGGAPRVVARNVSDFDLSPEGGAIAGLVHETASGYSVNLVLQAGDASSVTVARGVFGFGFSPDGRWLYYRTACTREAEACDLLRIPASGPTGSAPERIAEGVKSFEFAPGRPDRLLVTWSRKDRVALDLAIWEAGKLSSVDTSALPGSARFLGDAVRLAWIGNDPRRPGVYVAELP
jgi:hypothetical protein